MSNASSDPPIKHSGAWGPVAAFTVAALAFLGSQIVILMLVATIAGLVLGPQAAEDWIMSNVGQFVFVVLADVLVLIVLWLFLRRRHSSFRHLGLGRLLVWRDVGFASLGYVVYFVALMIAIGLTSALTSVNTEQCQDIGFSSLAGFWPIGLALVSLVLIQPITEEIVFRGFVFTGLRTRLHFVWATLLTSLAFGSLHLLGAKQGEGTLWIAGIDTLVLSVVLCFLREKTGALWAPILVHMLKNGIAFILLLTTHFC